MNSSLNYAQTSDEVVQQFFTALSSKDVETLDRLTLDNMQLHSLSVNDSIMLNASSKEMFIKNFKSIPENLTIEERIYDITSLKSDYLAQYKVPYSFYVNGELSHSGINVLTLIKKEDQWVISYIADTRKR
jgi:hypothetical protein